ncbi:MAG TPA: hypothetical protein VH761_05680, partial [Ilumatobacteraceae bacterium]
MADSELADVRRRLTNAATVSSYRLGSLAARLMPGPIAGAAAASFGFGASLASPAKRRVIARHLQRVNPQLHGHALRVAVQQAFDYYAQYYIESFRLPALPKSVVHDHFTVEGWDHVAAPVELGNGV